MYLDKVAGGAPFTPLLFLQSSTEEKEKPPVTLSRYVTHSWGAERIKPPGQLKGCLLMLEKWLVLKLKFELLSHIRSRG